MHRRQLSNIKTNHWALVSLLAVYLCTVLIMVLAGRYALIVKSVVIPLVFIMALLRRRGKEFIRDWLLFICLVFLFDYVRGFIFAMIIRFQLPVYLQYVIRMEYWFGGGSTWPEIFQLWRAGLENPVRLDRFLIIIHGSHFFVFLLIGFVVWVYRQDSFRQYQYAMLGVMYTGLLVYFLVPTIPPWMASMDYQVLPPIQRIGYSIYNAKLPQLFKVFDRNPIAAMPSLHCAFPMMCSLIAYRHFRMRGMVVYLYTLLVFIAVMYLGEHYLVDVFAGIILSVAIYIIVYHLQWKSINKRISKVAVRFNRLGLVILPSILVVLLSWGIGRISARMVPWNPSWNNYKFYCRELKASSPVAADRLAGYLQFQSSLRMDLIKIDDAIAYKKYDEAIQMVEALNSQRPGDPELCFWTCYYRLLLKRIDFRTAMTKLAGLKTVLSEEDMTVYREIMGRLK